MSYVAKSFIIDHPLDKERHLVHGCLEGPEAGVYYRGESRIGAGESSKIITLPTYVSTLADDFTVHVSQVADDSEDTFVQLSATRVRDGQFVVRASASTAFTWVVYGRRLAIDVEPKKSEVCVEGNGPYRWIRP